ncbi:hypothetical protein EGW08_008270, partial [Elysia chlorotica]
SESEGYVSAPEDGVPVASPRRRGRQDSGETASVGNASNTPSQAASEDSGLGGSQCVTPPSPSLSLTSSGSARPSTASTSTSSRPDSSRISMTSASSSSSTASSSRALMRKTSSASSDLPP